MFQYIYDELYFLEALPTLLEVRSLSPRSFLIGKKTASHRMVIKLNCGDLYLFKSASQGIIEKKENRINDDDELMGFMTCCHCY